MVGWDIGGAHVKIVRANKQAIIEVLQLACPLWKGIDKLRMCIETVHERINLSHSKHAVTMTGELVDYFENREQGTISIINELNAKLSEDKVFYYAGELGFINAERAIVEYKKVASANWLASACYTAEKLQHALFIDIGSTTTDIIPIKDGKVIYNGYTDEQRLIAKELVYCGVVRTPIFAICKSAIVKTQSVPVINEYFSNTADVYRITGELEEYVDVGETLDSRAKDCLSSVKRLARMFANDADSSELDIWNAVAKQVRSMQVQMIKDACRHQLMQKQISLDAPVVGAGVGRFLVKDVASQLGREYVDYESLFTIDSDGEGFGVGDCGPAAAVACLAMNS